MNKQNYPALAIIERAGIKIEIRTPRVVYIQIGDHIYYIDDSTNEQIIDSWHISEHE